MNSLKFLHECLIYDIFNKCPKCEIVREWQEYKGTQPEGIGNLDEKIGHKCCSCGAVIWTNRDAVPTNIKN